LKLVDGSDKTKEVLTEALRRLYGGAGKAPSGAAQNFLQGNDGQFLGKITDNPYDGDSITNAYGPYGSMYSPTSIHNSFSVYASPYSQLSINNPYTSTPPILFIRGIQRGRVTKNQFVQDGIDTDLFLYLIQNDIKALIENRIPQSIPAAAGHFQKAYLLGADDTYLGSLNPNHFDPDSIFNKFGQYGSKFSPTSIFNEFGPYGGKFSNLSPFNSFSNTPPTAYVNGQPVARVTVNRYLPGTNVDPNRLEEWARRVVGAA
jgi:hypothetical protein